MSLRKFIDNSKLVTCEPNSSIGEIAQLMEDNDVGSVLVCENNKAVGIVTDRDIALRCVSKHAQHEKCTAKDHMSSPLNSVSADAGIHDIASLMKDKAVRRVVVIDKDGAPLGIVSQGDMLKLIAMEMNEIVEGTVSKEEKLVEHEKAA